MTHANHPIPFADINAAACQRSVDLARHFFPNGRQEGDQWLVGNLAGEPGRSLHIVLSGPKCGLWKDFATNEGGGDLISLVAAKMRTGQAEAAKHLGLMLGVITECELRVHDEPLPQPDTRECAASGNPPPDGTEAARHEKALAIAKECGPIDGTPAAIYLFERGIDPGKLPLGQVAWHSPSGAVTYASRNLAGNLMAVQRVFLDPSGKAKLDPSGKKIKRTNGILKGSAFTLPGDGPDTLVCDGPEDALSLWQVTGAPVLCAFGMNWEEIPFPQGASLVLVADNDAPDGVAAAAVVTAVGRLTKRGFNARVTHPPADVKDANDLLRKRGPEAVRMMVVAAAPLAGVEVDRGATPDIKAQIIRLAKLSPLDYKRERGAAAKQLGLEAAALDGFVKIARSRKSATDADDLFPVVEPWPTPVDMAQLLDDIYLIIGRFIICDAIALRAVTLWVFFTWLIDHVQVAPLLVITAPEKRCGKSLLLSLVKRLTCRPLAASNISMAAVYRVIEAWAPTLVIDEADTFLGKNEELRGILNSGHTRESAYVVRLEGDDHEPRQFSTWGAKAISGIGHLAETLMDRAIVVELRRKKSGEAVKKLRHADPGDFDRLTRMLARCAEDFGETIGKMQPILPVELNDRAQDNWEPLLAIADHAGGHWPKTAREAALQLSGSSHEALSVSAELLTDIRDIFEKRGSDRIPTADLLSALSAEDERPWATYNKGHPLSARNLAKLLGEYGISPRSIWVGPHASPKGYNLDQFTDAFARYLSAKAPDDTVLPPPTAPHVLKSPCPLPPPAPPRAAPLPPPLQPYAAPQPLRPLARWTPIPPYSDFPKSLAAGVPASAIPQTAETLAPSGMADNSGDGEDEIDM